MKIYSLAIISLTLILFYNLAVHQQIERDTEQYEIHENKKSDYSRSTEIEFVEEPEEFSMQVTGKEHRYLNTGISYMEEPGRKINSQCIADSSKDSKPNLTGS